MQAALVAHVDPAAMVVFYEKHDGVPTHLDLSPLLGVIDLLYKDAYLAGYHVGAVQLQKAGAGDQVWAAAPAIDWDNWEPGSPDAAALLEVKQEGGAGLASLLGNAGVTIKGIEDTTLDHISVSLADSLAQGFSSAQAAKAIDVVLDDPARALIIAQTEMARAMTVATLDQYKANGVTGKTWILSDGACSLCEENEADGEVDINDDFTNGDPPVHPYCVCAVAPVLSSGELGEESDTGAVEDTPDVEDAAAEAADVEPLDWQNDTAVAGRGRKAVDFAEATVDNLEELDEFQDLATNYYSGIGYKLLNQSLRQGLTDVDIVSGGPFAEEAIDSFGTYDFMASVLDDNIAAFETNAPMVVYRGGWSGIADLEPGQVIEDKGFVSTSLIQGQAQAFGKAQVEIHVPEGAHALPILLQTASGTQQEAEVLLARGSRFVVDSVEEDRVIVRLLL